MFSFICIFFLLL